VLEVQTGRGELGSRGGGLGLTAFGLLGGDGGGLQELGGAGGLAFSQTRMGGREVELGLVPA